MAKKTSIDRNKLAVYQLNNVPQSDKRRVIALPKMLYNITAVKQFFFREINKFEREIFRNKNCDAT